MKIAFVILQYMAWKDTLECVESIRAHVGTEDYRIVIVDNGSPDDSYAQVRKKLLGSRDILLIRSKNNLGFARGNNVGYRYAREHFSPEYIILLNNDILLFQDGIYDYASGCYDRYGYAVLGPMILTADGSYTSSPMTAEYQSRPESGLPDRAMFERSISEFKLKLSLLKAHLFQPLATVKRTLSGPEQVDGSLYTRELVNYRVHGAFLILSEKYQKAFPDGLDSRTFMYDEEYFLQYHVMKAGMILLYSPSYCVFHKEDRSTSAMLGSKGKKTAFQLSNMIKSRELYLKMLDEEKD